MTLSDRVSLLAQAPAAETVGSPLVNISIFSAEIGRAHV